MEFTLHYHGPLKAASQRNKRKDHKHDLRKHFHRQLKTLWDTPRLHPHKRFLRQTAPAEGTWALLQSVGRFEFAPLVCKELRLVAGVEIVMLRPEPEGRIFVASGDIDNRLKTLLDALKMPNEVAMLPSSATPLPDESPFFCLLEDDALITNIDIKTAHWLEPAVQDPDEVVLLIRVRTSATDVVMGNLAFL